MDMIGAAHVARIYRQHCDLPIMVQPNAGLPVLENLKAVYKQLPADMAHGVPRCSRPVPVSSALAAAAPPTHTRAIHAVVAAFNQGK